MMRAGLHHLVDVRLDIILASLSYALYEGFASRTQNNIKLAWS